MLGWRNRMPPRRARTVGGRKEEQGRCPAVPRLLASMRRLGVEDG